MIIWPKRIQAAREQRVEGSYPRPQQSLVGRVLVETVATVEDRYGRTNAVLVRAVGIMR